MFKFTFQQVCQLCDWSVNFSTEILILFEKSSVIAKIHTRRIAKLYTYTNYKYLVYIVHSKITIEKINARVHHSNNTQIKKSKSNPHLPSGNASRFSEPSPENSQSKMFQNIIIIMSSVDGLLCHRQLQVFATVCPSSLTTDNKGSKKRITRQNTHTHRHIPLCVHVSVSAGLCGWKCF